MDYAALAKQNGGKVDYGALAKQVGGRVAGSPSGDPRDQMVQAKPKSTVSKIGNFVKNVGLFGSDLAGGVAKGVGSTIKSVGNIGSSVIDQTLGRVTNHGAKPVGDQAAQAKIDDVLTPKNTGEKIGFGAEKVGEFLIPGGAEADTANLANKGVDALKIGEKSAAALKLASKAGISAVSNAAVTTAQGGSGKDVENAGLLGAAFPVAGFVAKGLGRVGGAIAEHLASTLSGVPKAAIKHAIENPEAVQKAIKIAATDGEGATQKIYQNAVDALDNLKQARNEAYQTSLTNLEKDLKVIKGEGGSSDKLFVKKGVPDESYSRVSKIFKTAESDLESQGYVHTDLNTSGIKKVFTTTAKDFGAEGGGKGGLDFTNVALDDAHISKLQKLQDRIYNWTDTTPTGINKLRQVVDSYKVGGIKLGSSESKFNKIIGDLRTNLSNYVGERVPQIAKMNKEYATSSEVIDNIRNQLKIGSADPNTALRKLVNVFNPKSSLYKPVVDQLGEKAGKDLMSDIAGLTMSKWTPEGVGKYLATLEGGAALIHPAAAVAAVPTAILSSPRVVGELATRASKIAKNKAAQRVGSAAIRTGKAMIVRATRKKP